MRWLPPSARSALQLRRLSQHVSPCPAAAAPRRSTSAASAPGRGGASGVASAAAAAAQPVPCVCTVGDELLYGERESNGNERYILRALHERGTPAVMASQLPDDPEIIAKFIRFAREQHLSPIFIAGGLGGTHDDKTREAVALALDLPLTRHAECFEILTESFQRRDIEFTPQRQRMADLPDGCSLIENSVGAPGFAIDGIYAFPGFP